AADLDAGAQDVGAELLGARKLAWIVGVVEDERVEVAVAGVEDVGDAQTVFLREPAHPRQHLGEAAPRDRPVHAVIVGRDAADRGEGRLAAGPEGEALLLAAADADRDGLVLAGDALDRLEEMVDLGGAAVELDDEEGLDVERVAGVDE